MWGRLWSVGEVVEFDFVFLLVEFLKVFFLAGFGD
jgi:hypothetical protein